MLNLGINNLWSTPVYLGEIEDKNLLDDACQSIFLNVNLEVPISDFQEFDILNDGCEKMKQFRDEIVWPAFDNYLKQLDVELKSFKKRRLKSWIAGSRTGYMIPTHNHAGASISAVFYLMAEEKKLGGEIILIDPRFNANRGYLPEFDSLFSNTTFLPSSGKYLMFPSFLYHNTIPFTGNLRLAMPVDLFL